MRARRRRAPISSPPRPARRRRRTPARRHGAPPDHRQRHPCLQERARLTCRTRHPQTDLGAVLRAARHPKRAADRPHAARRQHAAPAVVKASSTGAQQSVARVGEGGRDGVDASRAEARFAARGALDGEGGLRVSHRGAVLAQGFCRLGAARRVFREEVGWVGGGWVRGGQDEEGGEEEEEEGGCHGRDGAAAAGGGRWRHWALGVLGRGQGRGGA